MNQLFFDDLGIRKPDYFLDAVGDHAAQTIARVIEKSDEVMAKEQPDAVMLYGDTNSCLAVIAAKRRKIPVFHMEAGNRCFDQRVPEETNRKDPTKRANKHIFFIFFELIIKSNFQYRSNTSVFRFLHEVSQ